MDSRWVLTAEHRLLYGSAFEGSVSSDSDLMPWDKARRHMSRSGLPEAQIEQVLTMVVQPASAAGLSENQFVVAMLLVSKGLPLPTSLPLPLLPMIAPSVAQSKSANAPTQLPAAAALAAGASGRSTSRVSENIHTPCLTYPILVGNFKHIIKNPKIA